MSEFPSLERMVSLYRCDVADGKEIARRAVKAGFVWGKNYLHAGKNETIWRDDGSRCVGRLSGDVWHFEREVIEKLGLEVKSAGTGSV